MTERQARAVHILLDYAEMMIGGVEEEDIREVRLMLAEHRASRSLVAATSSQTTSRRHFAFKGSEKARCLVCGLRISPGEIVYRCDGEDGGLIHERCRGPHDRPDCPCGHPPGTTGVCGGCNCADPEA